MEGRRSVEKRVTTLLGAILSGIFMETHENPKRAPSDGPNMVALKDLGNLIHKIILYDNLTKSKVLKNVRNF